MAAIDCMATCGVQNGQEDTGILNDVSFICTFTQCAWNGVKLEGGGWQGCQYRYVRAGTTHCTRRVHTDRHVKSVRGTVNSRPLCTFFMTELFC